MNANYWSWLRRSETYLWAGFGVILIALFARTMNEDLRHDEQMFVPAGALFSQLKLYTDFTYGHLPNLPLLLNTIYLLPGSDHYLLFGRLIVFVAWIVTLWLTYVLAYRLTSERLIAIVAALLMATNSVLVTHVGVTTSNNMTPILFPILGFYMFFLGVEGREIRPWFIAIAGLAVSLAAGFKVSYIVCIPPFALAALLVPVRVSFATRLVKVVLPLLAGGIVGSLATFYYLATDPAAFLFNTLEFHLGPQRAYWGSPEHADEVTGLTLMSRIFYAYRLWFFGSTVLVLIAAGYFASSLISAHQRRALEIIGTSWPVLLSGALMILSVFMSLMVKPSFPQYYMPPIPFAVIFAVCLYRLLDHHMRKAAQPVLVTIAIATTIMGGPYLFQDTPKLVQPSKWSVVKVHKIGRQISKAMENAGVTGKLLATHNPIYAIEGGLSVYPELATGSFFFRIGDVITPEQRELFHVASPTTLAQVLDRNPPDGILVGYEGELDAPLIAYAESRGYRKLPDAFGSDRYGVGTLYVRSGS